MTATFRRASFLEKSLDVRQLVERVRSEALYPAIGRGRRRDPDAAEAARVGEGDAAAARGAGRAGGERGRPSSSSKGGAVAHEPRAFFPTSRIQPVIPR